jgi:hypothetical protein
MQTVWLVGLTWAAAAPAPKDPPAEYYPTAVGTKWVYVDKDGVEEAREVTAAERVDGGLLVTVRRADGGPFEQVAVSSGRIDRVSASRFTFAKPYSLLKLPPKAGDSWDFDIDFDIAAQPGLLPQAGTMTVGKPETVEVPAGKFLAVPVVKMVTDQNGNRLAAAEQYTHWYASGVGLVKWTAPNGRSLVLKSFTPGKR